MDEPAAASHWVQGVVNSSSGIGASADRNRFVEDLVASVAQVTDAGWVYALLMEGSTVLADGGRKRDGSSYAPPKDPHQKRAARLSLAALRAHANDRDQKGVLAGGVEHDGKISYLPFVLNDTIAGTVILEHHETKAEGDRDVGFAAAFTTIAARVHALAEENLSLRRRADDAERRISSVEQSAASGGVGAVKYLKPVAELERDAIELALRTTSWNKEEAARRLGISRASIYMKVKKYGLQKPIP
jgi:transcriptional regulator with GAF, ATPase, and Fis domain